jgi:N-acylneuraminate cytidylyltransferase
VNFENCYFLIPARKGSKGFPLKNRKLFEYTIDAIPEEFKSKIYVSTDDEYIKELAKERKINIVDRPKELAQDKTSMKQVLNHFIKIQNITCNDDIILLYLTYPERTWNDIKEISSIYKEIKEKYLV